MEIKRVDIKKLSKSACSSIICDKCSFYFNADRGYIWVREKGGKRICYDCAEKYYNTRKEKLEWHLPRKDLKKIPSIHLKPVKCAVCEDVGKIPSDATYHWHLMVKDPPKHLQIGRRTKYEYDVCYECAETTVLYRQQYGFWLRGFVSEHFIPCEKCQDELHSLLFDDTIWGTVLPEKEPVELKIEFSEKYYKNDKRVKFMLNFVFQRDKRYREGGYIQGFKPCEKCGAKLKMILLEKELHIGSETKPPVELWRKMNQVIPELDKEEQDPQETLMQIDIDRQKEEGN